MCFWFGNGPEPFKWLLSWPCPLHGKTYLWSASTFTEPFRDLPNRTGGFTACHSREHSREFSQPAQGMVFFPNVFLEKAKHPTHRRSGKINGEGLDEASGVFCAVMSWGRPAVEEKGLPLLRKSLWDSLNHGPWEQ